MTSRLKPVTDTTEMVLDRLGRVRGARLWPHGIRDLWTDALGVLCLTNLARDLSEDRYLDEAEWVAQEVDRILGRARGIRMAEGPDGNGQSFRSQALWILALQRLGEFLPLYRRRALALVREIHAPFVRPGTGVFSRMTEDLRRPDPEAVQGTLEVFMGLAVYRQLDADALHLEIRELEAMLGDTCRSMAPNHDVDLGLLLWIAHFFSGESWALMLREELLGALDRRWVDPPGYFRRDLSLPWGGPPRANRLAISNLTTAIGLQAQGVWSHRVERIHRYFTSTYPWELSPEDPLAPVLLCVALNPGLLLHR